MSGAEVVEVTAEVTGPDPVDEAGGLAVDPVDVGGGGLAVGVLCAAELMILTDTSKRPGSEELQETISLRQLLHEKAGIEEE